MGRARVLYAGGLTLAAAVALTALASLADDIMIDHPGWSSLSEAEKTALQTRLRADGILSSDDVVKFKAGPAPKVVEKDVGLGAILAEICKAKTLSELAKCAKQPPADRDQCQKKEKDRQDRIKVKCK